MTPRNSQFSLPSSTPTATATFSRHDSVKELLKKRLSANVKSRFHQLHAKGGKRLGLLGMRERVEMVGGTFCIASAPGEGTTIEVEVPFAKVPKNLLHKSGKETPLECP